MSTALGLDDVSVSLGGRRVVDSVSLTVAEGEWAVVIGPNGAGKTTLLRAIAGLVPYEGTIQLLGSPSSGLGRRDRARLLAVVPQLPATPPWLTVAEYVLLGRTPYLGTLSRESTSDLDAAGRAIERLDLAGYADRLLGTLSGGERQRVVVARAVAQEAPIVLLDEPTSALDLGYQQQALELLDELRRSGELTLLAAMHDLTLAAQYADRMILLDHGCVVADGSPHDVVTEEAIARHYGATVEVVATDNRFAVIPRRGGQASA
jgi:iron complex transport system ATP-binding protein